MGKQSAPPAPDYAGAAQATAQGNLEAARTATKANRVNYNTPYGSLSYSQNPNDQDLWTANVQLDPSQQQLLDQQNKSAAGLAGLQDQALGRVDQTLSSPFDYGSVQDVQNQAYKSYTDRLDPQWGQRESALETKLANQGIARGSEAYTNAMRDFNSGRNDAYSQAQVSAINTMPQTMQLASALRNQPLNELNALRTGSQVTNPTFSNVPQQATTAGADMLGATTAGYNAQLGGVNASNAASGNFMNGLMGLGGSLGSAAILSDARLKSNIKRIGRYKHHNVYSYIKFGKPEIGVMAQEVMLTNPEAIHVHPSGYLMVDYGRL
jgi:hypothetical protein